MKTSKPKEYLFPKHLSGVLNDIGPTILKHIPSITVFQIDPDMYIHQFRLKVSKYNDPVRICSEWLIKSAEKGYEHVVLLLLKEGHADPGIMDSDCIKGSVVHCHNDILKLLLEDGRADPRALNTQYTRILNHNRQQITHIRNIPHNST